VSVFLLSQYDTVFPPAELAGKDGLLAVGGDLSVRRLLSAYAAGIFPWYAPGEPILWWSPDPRLVLYPDALSVSRSLRKILRQQRFTVTFDHAFERVIRACAASERPTGDGTWLVPEMITAYCDLHAAGWAHSVEAWQTGRLAGGLYGVAIGRCFFGESMFSRVSNASKVALVHLVRRLSESGYGLIDCQVTSDHLLRLGACEIPRARFLDELKEALKDPSRRNLWPKGSQGTPSAALPGT
jgi:leucyl/phenylalanyl-tRNA--protein transferase